MRPAIRDAKLDRLLRIIADISNAEEDMSVDEVRASVVTAAIEVAEASTVSEINDVELPSERTTR